MILTLKNDACDNDVKQLLETFEKQSFTITSLQAGNHLHVYGILGDTSKIDDTSLKAHHCVENITRIQAPYKLCNRLFHPQDTIIDVNGIKIGGQSDIVMIAGPCAVESEEQIMRIAKKVKNCGATMLRGGAYKPRTSPYAFQGLQSLGISYLKKAGSTYQMPIVSELMSKSQLDEFIENVDIIQIGARNMQNFDLLKAVGKTKKPILLKRGLANTIEEWIMSAEYIMSEGNPNVIFCERGIRTFENYTRNTLDLSVIPIIKEKTHLPIIIDPSHAAGDYKLIKALSLAAIAAGADGLMIEVHDQPQCALSDGDQSLLPERYLEIITKGRQIANVVDRHIK